MTSEHIRQLLQQRTETKNLDFKERASWLKDDLDGKLSLVKDILSMANTRDGGTIVIGVKDRTFEFVGIEKEDFDSFDQTGVNDFVHRYTEPLHSCQVYKDVIDDKRVVVIVTPEFAGDPILCKSDAHSSVNPNKQILRTGTVYIRSDKGTSAPIGDVAAMRELLGRALQKRRAELYSDIHAMLYGSPAKQLDLSTQKYADEMTTATEFFEEAIDPSRGDRGYWEVTAYPVDYVSDRVKTHSELRDIFHKSVVSIRGWDFPHSDQQNSSNFGSGIQSHTLWDHFIEGYRAFLSGHFVARRTLWEDISSYRGALSVQGPVLEFISAIYTVSEFFTFFARYFSSIVPDGAIRYRIAMHGTKERQLVSPDIMVELYGPYKCVEPVVECSGEVTVAELQATYKQLAETTIRKMFAIFNWNTISERGISQWQDKFFERRF